MKSKINTLNAQLRHGDRPFIASRHPRPEVSECDLYYAEDNQYNISSVLFAGSFVMFIAIIGLAVWWACGDDVKFIFK